MNDNYEKDYMTITGLTDFGEYISPEEQASRIKKCSILMPIDITFSDRINEDSSKEQQMNTVRKHQVKLCCSILTIFNYNSRSEYFRYS